MKKLILPMALIAGVAMSPMTFAEDAATNNANVVTLTNGDGETIRAKVHPEDMKHIKKMKEGNNNQLMLGGDPSTWSPTPM